MSSLLVTPGKQAQYKEKDWLIEKYSIQKLSLKEVAQICNLSSEVAVLYWMKKFSIERRTAGGYWQDKVLSESHRRKLSTAKKGKNYGRVGKNHPMYGKKAWNDGLTAKDDSRILGGEDHPMYGVQRFGDANPNWRNGGLFQSYGTGFVDGLKEKIRKRDNFTCQVLDCNAIQNGRKFPVHHIDYDKWNNKWWNLITLCSMHHGRTGKDREYWQQYFEQIMYGGKIWEVF